MKVSNKKNILLLVILFNLIIFFIFPKVTNAVTSNKNGTEVTMSVAETCTFKLKSKKKVKWSSSNKKVVTITKKGKVTAKKKGIATVTGKVGKKKYKCNINVEAPSLNLKNVLVYTGKKFNLKLNGTTQSVKWSSSNSVRASVSKTGEVTAKKTGNVTITAKVGKKKYKCKVQIKLDLEESDIWIKKTNVSYVPVKTFGTKGYKYLQGFCSDSTYYYTAVVTPKNPPKKGDPYKGQKTILTKIRKSDGKVVKKVAYGEIGHSNCLTYNPNTNKILISETGEYHPYVFVVNPETLKIEESHILYKSSTVKDSTTMITNGNLAYDKEGDFYIRYTANYMYIFDSAFNYLKRIPFDVSPKADVNCTTQCGTCDSNYLYIIYNDFSKGTYINYILKYNYQGHLLDKMAFAAKLGNEKMTVEFEGISEYNGEYYISANTRNSKGVMCGTIYRIGLASAPVVRTVGYAN